MFRPSDALAVLPLHDLDDTVVVEAFGIEEFPRQVSARAKTWIDALQSEPGTSVKMFINTGDPAKVVASAAGEFGADLLVMGRHGAGAGIAGHLFQNAYAILCESPCPVISI